jgi:hypothetical protein
MLTLTDRFAVCRVALVLMLAAAGCGGDTKMQVPTARVSGKVSRGGKPLAGVEVNFVTADFASVGKTDAEGKFTLVQGAAIGENKVYLVKRTGQENFNDVEGGIDAGQLEAMQSATAATSKKVKPEIPEDYSDPGKSILKFTVPEGGTDAANFDLPD